MDLRFQSALDEWRRWWPRILFRKVVGTGLVWKWYRMWLLVWIWLFFSVHGDYDKCWLLEYVSDMKTYVGLSFCFPVWVGCGNYVEILLWEETLWFKFSNLIHWWCDQHVYGYIPILSSFSFFFFFFCVGLCY